MKHFVDYDAMDDVLITSKFIPTMLANPSGVSYDLSRLITHKSSRGATGHLYSSFPPSVDARGLRPWLTLTSTVHIDLCSYGAPVLVGAPVAGDRGNEASLYLWI